MAPEIDGRGGTQGAGPSATSTAASATGSMAAGDASAAASAAGVRGDDHPTTLHVNLNLPEKRPRRIVKAAAPKSTAKGAEARREDPEQQSPSPTALEEDAPPKDADDGESANGRRTSIPRVHSFPHPPAGSALAREWEHELVDSVKQGTLQKAIDRRKHHQDKAKRDRRRSGGNGQSSDPAAATPPGPPKTARANPFTRFLSAFSVEPRHPEHKRRAAAAAATVAGKGAAHPPPAARSIPGENDDADARPPAEKRIRSDDASDASANEPATAKEADDADDDNGVDAKTEGGALEAPARELAPPAVPELLCRSDPDKGPSTWALATVAVVAVAAVGVGVAVLASLRRWKARPS